MNITAEEVYAFSQTFLWKSYDSPVKTPEFHKEIWDLCCSDTRKVAIAAPRGHAKSTCVTLAFVLAAALFREKRYILIVSDTESQASEFLSTIKMELLENEDLRRIFEIKRLTKDAVTWIICEMADGHKFCIRAFGAEQKVRGRLWRNTRPDLVVGDDMENDEAVENQDRREKMRNWVFKALVPALAKKGHIRIIGTILHLDSVLYRLQKNRSWASILYKAHDSFDDFTNILWPEQWNEERLRAERQSYIDEGYPEGYSQEYLNNPIDLTEAFFRKEDFLEMEIGHHHMRKNFYAAADFAISDDDRADWTVFVVGGMDEHGMLDIVEVVRFRGDASEIINWMLALQNKWDIQLWKCEEGAIKKALFGEINRRMLETGTFMNLVPAVPTKDKRTRARGIQARMRAGGVRFDKEATWYAGFEEELCQFPKGAKKDQVDAIAWLGIALNELHEGPSRKELDDEAYEEMKEDSMYYGEGRSGVTGY